MEVLACEDAASDPGAHPAILDRVVGKVLAVDVSTWIFHATNVAQTADYFDPEGQVAKLVFERASNWLRHGVVPIGVLDGTPPAEKLERMRARHGARATGAGGGRFERLNAVAADVLRHLGLPVVRAPGEAEATCAALDRLGCVDGCATADGDALLFGATRVYKKLNLSADFPTQSRLEATDALRAADALGLAPNPHRPDLDARRLETGPALVALALLAGGDYDVDGANRVGATLAARVVRRLADEAADAAASSASPVSFPERLDALLASPIDAALEAMSACTGCATCKHDGGGKSRKKRCGRGGCAECGTESAGGGCVPRPDAACGCPFHRRSDERWMEKVKRRARETEGYADRFQRAAAAYAAQAEGALVGVEVVDPDDPENHPDARGGPASSRGRLPPPGEKFEWRRRPDAAKFCRVLRDLCDIPTRRAREKLLPLLLHWDLRAGAEVPRDASEGERFRRLRALGVEFVASRVRKPQRNRGFAPWRYLIDVDAADPSESAAFRAAREREREERKRGKKPPPGVSESEDDRSDEAAEEDARDGGKTEVVRDLEVFAKRTAYRAVRLGLVRETCAGLVAAMEAGEREASGTTRDGERRQSTLFGAPAGVPATPARRKATPRRGATPDPAQTSIRGFFTPTGPRRRELFPAGPKGDAKTPEAAPRPGANGDEDDDDDEDSSPRASPALSAGSDGSAEIARAGLRPVTVVHRDRESRAGAGGPGAGVSEPPPPPPDVVELLTPSPDVVELLTPPTPGEEGKRGVARGGGGGRPRATPRGISDEGSRPGAGGGAGGSRREPERGPGAFESPGTLLSPAKRAREECAGAAFGTPTKARGIRGGDAEVVDLASSSDDDDDDDDAE